MSGPNKDVQIFTAAYRLSKDELSHPIELMYGGYSIIKLIEKREPVIRTFKDSKPQTAEKFNKSAKFIKNLRNQIGLKNTIRTVIFAGNLGKIKFNKPTTKPLIHRKKSVSPIKLKKLKAK